VFDAVDITKVQDPLQKDIAGLEVIKIYENLTTLIKAIYDEINKYMPLKYASKPADNMKKQDDELISKIRELITNYKTTKEYDQVQLNEQLEHTKLQIQHMDPKVYTLLKGVLNAEEINVLGQTVKSSLLPDQYAALQQHKQIINGVLPSQTQRGTLSKIPSQTAASAAGGKPNRRNQSRRKV
jgi:hypothetical protein